MTSEQKIDHVAEALSNDALAWNERHNPELRATFSASAQMHATLAVAAQQKYIADWLANLPLAGDGSPVTSPNPV